METPKFTYDGYALMLEKLRRGGYQPTDYSYLPGSREKVVILRHDIDTSIEKACRFAELEQEFGVKSTYFVLVTSGFYNVFSEQAGEGLHRIMECGHEIGLHFDELRYPEIAGNAERCIEKIRMEAHILGEAAGREIKSVSYHRPGREILAAELEIPGMVNSYGGTFFRKYKYLSDSRRRWREPVLDIITSGQYSHLHILTHAFWYQDREEPIHDTVCSFVNRANAERFYTMSGNITDIHSIMQEEEVR